MFLPFPHCGAWTQARLEFQSDLQKPKPERVRRAAQRWRRNFDKTCWISRQSQHSSLSGYEVLTRGNAKLQNGLTVFTAAVFIVAQVAAVGAGWTGFGLLVLCWLASGYRGAILGRSWVILRERHDEYKSHVRNPYPAIGEKACGRWASLAVTVSILICCCQYVWTSRINNICIFTDMKFNMWFLYLVG